MAVDYFHRLVVWGPQPAVGAFTQAARRRARYGLPGKRPALTEVISFSFEALWARKPLLRRFAAEPPCDPYHLRAWPRRSVRPGVSFARYQFQTRNMEMQRIVRLLSLGHPRLAFVLVTLCLDVSEIQSWLARGGRASKYTFPDSRLDELIEVERAKLPGGARSGDGFDTARDEAEFVAIEEAMHRWDGRIARFLANRPAGKAGRRATPRKRGAKRAALGRYPDGPLEWFYCQEKRDRLNDLNLILLDDSRRNPELRKFWGLK